MNTLSRKLATLSLLLLAAPLGAAVPSLINFQGRLTDADDNAVTAATPVTFKLYTVETGGTAAFTESQVVTPDSNGLYNVFIGSTVSLGGLSFDQNLWLEVTVNGETLSPRYRLTASPYALQASSANYAAAVPWSGITGMPAGFADGTDDGAGGGSLTADSVGTEHIKDSTITVNDMAANSVGGNQIIDSTITNADINDVAWGKLTGVPAGFADGVDDTAGGLSADSVGTTHIIASTVALVDLNTTDVDTRYLTTGTAQSVSGAKIFTAGINAQGGISNSGGDVQVGDNLVVTGTSDLQGTLSDSGGNLQINDTLEVNTIRDFSGGNVVLQDDAGNVGIGATTLNGKLHIAAGADHLVFEETDAAADNKKWLLKGDGTNFEVIAANDAFGSFGTALQATRSGSTISSVRFPEGGVGIGASGGATGSLTVNSTITANGVVAIPIATTVDNTSPGLVLGEKLADDFVYDTDVLNHFGLGFHSYSGVQNMYFSDYFGMDFFTSGANRLRINQEGKIGVGTVDPAAKFHIQDGSATISGTNAALVLGSVASAPPTPSNAAVFFSSGTPAEMWVIDASGNATQLSPHDDLTGEWIFFSKNLKTGRVVRVDMERLIRRLEDVLGEKFLMESYEKP